MVQGVKKSLTNYKASYFYNVIKIYVYKEEP